MNPAEIKASGDDQIIGGYMETIRRLPKETRLNELADLLAVTTDSEMRKPLLREFNDLSEGNRT